MATPFIDKGTYQVAKIYSPPENFPAPPHFDTSLTFDENIKNEEAWIERLRKFAKKNGSGQYAGEVVRDPVADGYALYMVFSLRPLTLIHLPLGDAYQSRWAHRWTASDVKKMAESEKALRELFAKKG